MTPPRRDITTPDITPPDITPPEGTVPGSTALLALDTAGLYFRAFYAVPEKITDPAGTPVNAVRGVCDMLAQLLTDTRPRGVLAAADAQWRPQWRVAAIPSYKAHRVGADGGEAAPDTLAPQVGIIWEVLSAVGVPTAFMDDAEADDVLASLPLEAAQDGTTVIVTGDRDLFQLARLDVGILYIGAGMAKRHYYGPAEVAARAGLAPGTPASAYADVAILVGDPSDGLPGVPGIGAAGAAKLVTAFGSIDGILAAAADDSRPMAPKQRAALLDAAEYLRAAQRVVALRPRPEAVQVTGDRQGRLAPLDTAAIERLIERTGQRRAIERLIDALAPLRSPAPGTPTGTSTGVR